MNKTIACLSGGLDSTVLLAKLLDEGHTVKTIAFNYGQRHAQNEISAAVSVAAYYGVKHITLDLRNLQGVLTGSALTTYEIPVPHGHYEEESMRSTVVPNRNMIFLSLAAGYAVAQKFNNIAFAAHSGDHAVYPDCRSDFILAMNDAIQLGNDRVINLLAPFKDITKTDIVRIGADLKVPFDLTYSCYEGGRDHCGLCGTCTERRESFNLNNILDPTRYKEIQNVFC